MTMLINPTTLQRTTEREFRAANPQTSFPAVIAADTYAEFGLAVVFPAPQPAHDPITQGVRESDAVLTNKGHWEQTWEVYALDPEQVASNTQTATANLIQSVTQSVQQRLDNFAKTRNYDGILSACTYATSPTLKFQTEGQYCVEARDNTWATLYQIMREVEVGTRPMPAGYADIENELPSLTWPI